MRPFSCTLAAGYIASFLLACAPESDRPAPVPSSPPAVSFVDVAAEAGIHFRHTSGRSGRKYGVETIGSGAAFLDFNSDGFVDLYVVNGADLPGHVSEVRPRNALYRNEGNGRFAEIAVQAGVADTSYGMGISAGDYDNDGDTDIFLTNFGPNILYRNEGEGNGIWHFTDVTGQTILGDDRGWSTGCAFVDYDVDGDLDLYVANYLDYSFEADALLADGTPKRPRRHLAPTEYPARRDFLYRNDGDEHFVDVTEEAGLLSLEGRELGAVFFDFDFDGDPDLFQGNDATPNFLYRNDGGTFSEVGLLAGVAYNAGGKPEGTMGVDAADVDGDGDLDLVMSNFQWESNTLYENLGNGFFRDRSIDSGIGATSFDRLGFGINLFDADNDGYQDLYVVNGHIDEDIEEFDPQAAYAQRDQLYLNDGRGHFEEISARAGPGLALEMVGRGSAVADYDNDGDLDVFVLNTNQQAVLLRNDTPSGNHWLSLRLRGTSSNRDGFGARVSVRAGALTQMTEARSATSYLSQSDPRLFFGLGRYDRADLVQISWPSGIRQELREVRADQFLEVVEPSTEVPGDLPVPAPTASAIGELPRESAESDVFWQEAPMVLPKAVRRSSPGPAADLDSLKAAAADGADREAYFALAKELHLRRDYAGAEAGYRRALALNSGSAAAFTGLGQLYTSQGDFERAIRAFQEAMRLEPASPEPRYYLANIHVRQQQFAQAVPLYEQTLTLEPGRLTAYVNLAALHSRQSDYGPAIRVLRQGLEALPDHVELRFRLGWIYFIQAQYGQALEELRAVVRLEPSRSEAYEIMARIHLQRRDAEQSLQVLHQGLAEDPSSSALRARLGILLIEQGKPGAGVEHLERAVRTDPDNAEALYSLGQACMHLDEVDRGRSLLRHFRQLQDNFQNLLDHKTAIVLNPADSDAYCNLGIVYGRIERYEGARQAYTAALRINPRHLNALNNLGNIYLRQRHLDLAMEAFRRVLHLDSTYVRAYNNLGNAHLLAGQEDRAIDAFERAVQLDPGYARPRPVLARLYMKHGRKTEAEDQLAVYRRLTGVRRTP